MSSPYRPEAPGPLGIVEAFLNTLDVESGTDVWTDPQVLGRWLKRWGLIDRHERVETPADLDRAVALREALRDVMTAAHDGTLPSADAVAVIEAVADRAGLTLRLDGDATRLVPQVGGVDGALGRVLAIVHAAQLAGTWQRLKVCGNDTCRWAFYDASRNRSRTWCSMQVCGNRTKVRRFRERQGG